MAANKYMVYLEPAEEGGYIVSCPDFPGRVIQGETVEEALDMIKDPNRGCVSSLKKHNEPIPGTRGVQISGAS